MTAGRLARIILDIGGALMFLAAIVMIIGMLGFLTIGMAGEIGWWRTIGGWIGFLLLARFFSKADPV